MPATPDDTPLPGDKKDLAELKEQRRLIAEHLEWLERQIAAEERPEASPKAMLSEDLSDHPPRRPVVSPLQLKPRPQPQPPQIPPVPGEPLLLHPTEAFDESQAIQAGRTNANNLRLGCIAMAIIAVIGVIGFFFVVPYFIF